MVFPGQSFLQWCSVGRKPGLELGKVWLFHWKTRATAILQKSGARGIDHDGRSRQPYPFADIYYGASASASSRVFEGMRGRRPKLAGDALDLELEVNRDEMLRVHVLL